MKVMHFSLVFFQPDQMYLVDCKTNAVKKIELVGIEQATKKDLKKLQQISLNAALISKIDWNLFEIVPSMFQHAYTDFFWSS